MSEFVKMSAVERFEFRKAVMANAGWKPYRIKNGLNAASMSGENWQNAGRALGIDPALFVAPVPAVPPVPVIRRARKALARALRKLADRVS